MTCDLQPEDVAELAFERGQIGIDRSRGIAALSPADVVPGPGGSVRAFALFLGLADRKVPGDDLAGQRFRIGGGRDGPGMAHADIALQ